MCDNDTLAPAPAKDLAQDALSLAGFFVNDDRAATAYPWAASWLIDLASWQMSLAFAEDSPAQDG